MTHCMVESKKRMDGNMKYVKRVVLAVVYVVFAYFYALLPEFHLKGGLRVSLSPFNFETFVMMLFIGIYLTAFWIIINRLFRN